MSDWYQIENSYFAIQLNSSGAEIKRIFAKPWRRELLWVPNTESDKKIWSRTSPILFPIVGKLKDDTYSFEGKSYKMAQHGFARDRDFKCLTCTPTEIEFLLEADQETFKSYPFCFELLVRYFLDENKLKITYSVKNVDRQDIYFSIGAHPAFETKKIEDYEIHFEKIEKGFLQLSNGLINWNQLHPLTNKVITPTKEMFANDALIFKDVKSKYIDLVDNKRHEVIRVSGTETPYLGIWAKDSVPFVCIEPWHGISDDADHDQKLESKVGIKKLAIGKTFDFSYSIQLLST